MSHTQSAQTMSSTKSITLVLGGARNGKSRYAQQLGERAGRVVFIATAEAREDPEMRSKIARHQSDRLSTWATIEETIELGQAIRSAASTADLILIDCLTLFAANLLERFGEETAASHHEVDALCEALTSAPCSIVLVSNEVGHGVVPAFALGRRFRDLNGAVNQRIAAQTDNVLFLIAGLPLILKGEPPL